MLLANSRVRQRARLRHVTCVFYKEYKKIKKSKVEGKSNRQQEDKLWEGTVKSWSGAKLCGRFGRNS